ncbi:MAG: DUF5715 family protein, partial [Gemmatimonadaceae bacterium]
LPSPSHPHPHPHPRSRRHALAARTAAIATTAVLVGGAALAMPLQAQTQATLLRGSRASVQRMHRQAVDHDLTFFETPAAVRAAVKKGRIERLSGNRDFRLHAVSFPYVIASTRVFVERLGQQYRSACGERMVVTSAVRPETRQPANSSDESVHPTGMAVDLRKPSGRCLTWLRSTLADLEKAGVLEATEERHPVHFHVAVFPQPYAAYLGGVEPARIASDDDGSSAAATPAPATMRAVSSTTRYRVRSGDTLWHLARRYGTTVKRLRSMNDLSSSRLRPGQTLLVPSAD